MTPIDEFTICLHCGYNRDIVNKQINALQSLNKKYRLFWNNRIDRYPKMYPTYSQLINHSIVTSLTEWVILINDRCSPTIQEVERMLNLLQNGFSCVLLYNVGFMGFSKELIREIGWWDERFIQGWEDRDWVWRIKLADLSLYESQEGTYNYDIRSPLNHPPGQCREEHLRRKYTFFDNVLLKHLPEQEYQYWDLFVGDKKPNIKDSWKQWNDSILNIGYDKPNSGQSSSHMVSGKKIQEAYVV